MHLLFALAGVAEATIVPFVPLLLRERGFGAADIGILLAVMSLAAFASGPAWGYAADTRYGRELTLAACTVAAAVASVLVYFAHTHAALALAVVALWAFRAPNASLADAIALDRLGGERRTEYGSVRLWASIGWAVAVVGWGAVIAATSYGVSALLYPAALLVVVAWLFGGVGVNPRGAREKPDIRVLRTFSRPLLVFLAALLLAQAAFAAGFNFSSLRIAGLGGSAVLVAVAASLQAVSEAPVMAWMTRVRAVIAPRHFYVAGCAIYALVLLVGFALTYVGSVVVVDELVPPQLRASGQVAARSVSFGLAPVVGAFAGGLVYGNVGPAAMFVGAALLAVLAAIVTLLPQRRRPGSP